MATLTVHLKPSRRLTIILCLAHFIAASMLFPLALPVAVKLAGVAMLIISLAYYLRKDALLSADGSIINFELSDEMQCKLTARSGKLQVCSILGSTFVASYLTVLILKPENKFFIRSIVILPDSIDAEVFRLLRVLLRWKWKDKN